MQEGEAVAIVQAVVKAVQELKAALHVVAPHSKEAVHLFERLGSNAHLLGAGVYEGLHGGGGGPHATLEGVQRTLCSARDDVFRRLLTPWYACIFARFDAAALVGRVGSQLGDHLSDLDRGISRATWRAFKSTASGATAAAQLLPAGVVEKLAELRALPSRPLFVDRQVLRLVALACVGSPQQQAAASDALRRMPGASFAAAPAIDGSAEYAANREALVVRPRKEGASCGLQRLLAPLLVASRRRLKNEAAAPAALDSASMQQQQQQPQQQHHQQQQPERQQQPAPASPADKLPKQPPPTGHANPSKTPNTPKIPAFWRY